MNKRIKWLSCMVFVIMLSGLLWGCSASAVEMAEYGAKYIYNDDPALVEVDIIDFKVALYDMGFYSAGVSSTTLQTKALDDLTMAAVKKLCMLNPDLAYYVDGVSNEVFWRVMGIMDEPLVTPLEEKYRVLLPGEKSSDVTAVQERLNQLGYDAAGYSFTAGLYDNNMQAVIDEFIRCNKYIDETDSIGITKKMQATIFAEDAIAFFKPDTQKVAFRERILGWLGASTAIVGISLPNYALIIIGFLLICIIMYLTFEIISPAKKNVVEPVIIEFKIECEDKSTVYSANIAEQCVRIGREIPEFPLIDNEDRSISRRHCDIYYENGKVILDDHSTYGTEINDVECRSHRQVLRSGDVLKIGKHRIQVQFKERKVVD